MADKVGLLITTTPGDWIDYVDAFTDVWVKKLGHSNNSIKRGPSGGAQGKLQKIVQAARDFRSQRRRQGRRYGRHRSGAGLQAQN